MTDEQQTVTGEVASTVDWKSGKGSWVNLKDNSNDFFAFKGGVPKVGESGTWTVKEGTGPMSDKVELVKAVKEATLKEKIKAQAEAEVKEFEKLAAKGDDVYFDRQNLIVRQTCMKAAAMVVSGSIERKPSRDWPKFASCVCDVADKLYDWVVGNEPSLPEPPEEP